MATAADSGGEAEMHEAKEAVAAEEAEEAVVAEAVVKKKAMVKETNAFISIVE